MTKGLIISNRESSREVWDVLGAPFAPSDQNQGVTENRPDWYFRDWMQHFGKRQAALVNELGWNKQKANFLWHGKQPYGRDIVNEVSSWLGIEPYEILMPPAEALTLRQFRQAALAIAAGLPQDAKKGRDDSRSPSEKPTA